MRAILIVCFVVLAMAFAQEKGQEEIVIHNPDPAFSRPSQPPSGSGPSFVINDADSAFYRPSLPESGAQNRPYPYKQYDNAFARGGK